jgi:hypothetical protein
VKETGDRSMAALAPRLAADLYGLEIIAENVEDTENNVTRFVVLSRDEEWAQRNSAEEKVVTTFVFNVRNIPAALYKALGGFATNGINMTKLESYQIGGKFIATQFYADVQGHPDDPALRPDDDTEAWFVLVNVARHGTGSSALVDWDAPELSEGYADRILDVMAARGVDVRERVLWREIISPADLMRRTMTPGGSIYGTSSNGATAAFLRPANRSPIPGLFLVGGSSHPGGGLPLVTLSAQIVDELIADVL